MLKLLTQEENRFIMEEEVFILFPFIFIKVGLVGH